MPIKHCHCSGSSVDVGGPLECPEAASAASQLHSAKARSYKQSVPSARSQENIQACWILSFFIKTCKPGTAGLQLKIYLYSGQKHLVCQLIYMKNLRFHEQYIYPLVIWESRRHVSHTKYHSKAPSVPLRGMKMQYVGVLLLLFNKREVLVSLETWWRVKILFSCSFASILFQSFCRVTFFVSSLLFSLLWISIYEQSCYFSLATLEL